LSTHLKEKEEKILQILASLAEQSSNAIPIIVEGKKDIEALRALNIEGPILTAKTGGRSFMEFVSEIEKLGAKEIVLLLDFDRRGKKWTKRLRQYFEKTEIKPNIAFWLELLSLVGSEVKDVEGLATYMETLKSKIVNS